METEQQGNRVNNATGDDVKCAAGDEYTSLGDYGDADSLPPGDELVAGSDSGVEVCGGRALSSGGGTRSCASSVVSCGSGCGSESSSLNNAPHNKTKRKVNVCEPNKSRGGNPLGSSTPRSTVARGPNLATRERARSREKPTPPEKPRQLTTKTRLRPTPDLPSLTRESPALRVRPTKTSSARCRTPNSPVEDGRKLPTSVSIDIDKYATLPRRRRDNDGDRTRGTSAGRDGVARRTPPGRATNTLGRSSARARVRIYAEVPSQTALIGEDIERILDGREILVARTRCEVSHRGVQADRRDSELERLETRIKRANEEIESLKVEAGEERSRRLALERELDEERKSRVAAQSELESNSRRLLEMVGSVGGDCLTALEEQLATSAKLAAGHREEIDRLRGTLRLLQQESEANEAELRKLRRQLASTEEEASEMQEFLTVEKNSLQVAVNECQEELERCRAECRQLVRVCERKRQEALAASARLQSAAAAENALDALADRLRMALSADRSPDDDSADLLDSETEPKLDDTDPPLDQDSPLCSTIGSMEDLSPVRDSDDISEQSSLHQLSRAIVNRQRIEADGERLAHKLSALADLLSKVLHDMPSTTPYIISVTN